MPEKRVIDPWGSELPADYERIVKQFGLEFFNPNLFPKPNRLMRRGAVFAGRDLKTISDCIKAKKPFYALTGIMPSGEKLHLGNKMVVEQMKYFQEHGAKTFVLVADLESAATRGVMLEEAQQRAKEFHIPAYIALGLNPKKTTFYFQSENKRVLQLAYEFAKKITLAEFKAVYGNADPGRIMSAVTQAGDMLFPQLDKRIPGIIPVGIDQDPHIRLCRDIVARTRQRNGFFPISSIYHKFTPSLDGSLKMSKSEPYGNIELPEDISQVCKKIRGAFSGGRATLEEHRKLGGVPEKDMTFQLLKLHLVEDDEKLEKVYHEYKSGEMTTGELKQLGCELITKFMNDFSKKLAKARKQVDRLCFIGFE